MVGFGMTIDKKQDKDLFFGYALRIYEIYDGENKNPTALTKRKTAESKAHSQRNYLHFAVVHIPQTALSPFRSRVLIVWQQCSDAFSIRLKIRVHIDLNNKGKEE
jgi:hypothetical protein